MAVLDCTCSCSKSHLVRAKSAGRMEKLFVFRSVSQCAEPSLIEQLLWQYPQLRCRWQAVSHILNGVD